jgi:hypothetical protein
LCIWLELERDVVEGVFHTGLGAVVQAIGVKPRRCLTLSAGTHKISNSMVAPTSAVLPLGSNGGDTSTTSPPIRLQAVQATHQLLGFVAW